MQLLDLPAEIQLAILESEPSTLPRMAQVNHWFRELTLRAIVRYFGDRPISRLEFKTHLQSQPQVLGVRWVHQEQLNHLSIGTELIFGITAAVSVIIRSNVTAQSDDTVTLQLMTRPVVKMTFAEITHELREPDTFDLRTQYLIVSRRRQCVEYAQEHGRHYAREWVLTVLDRLSKWAESNEVGFMLGLYSVLVTHAIILRTRTLPRRELLSDLRFVTNLDDQIEPTRNSAQNLELYQEICTLTQTMLSEIRDYFRTL